MTLTDTPEEFSIADDPILQIVRNELEARNWSTEFLAQRASVPGSTLRSWLNGNLSKKGLGSIAIVRVLKAIDYSIRPMGTRRNTTSSRDSRNHERSGAES